MEKIFYMGKDYLKGAVWLLATAGVGVYSCEKILGPRISYLKIGYFRAKMQISSFRVFVAIMPTKYSF